MYALASLVEDDDDDGDDDGIRNNGRGIDRERA